MADTSGDSASWQPAGRGVAGTGRDRASAGGSVLAFAVIVAGSIVLGLGAGRLWAFAAPRPVFVVTSPGQANLVQAETTAFIVADAWYSAIAAAGGAVIGLAGYRFAVRRYGPVPMAAIGAGAAGAGLAARWSGQGVGIAAFNRQLAVSRTGTLLHAPVALGAHSAMAIWPLAALVAAGGIELLAMLRARSASTASAPGYPGAFPPGPAAYPGPYQPASEGRPEPYQPGPAGFPGPYDPDRGTTGPGHKG